ncbi:MAG: tetratricopeptide repeat protein [Verrucomicrobiia bacterium]
MFRSGAIYLLTLCVGLFYIAGCKTNVNSGSNKNISLRPTPAPVCYWDESGNYYKSETANPALESRSEALARFATAFSLELKNDLTNALDNYFKASLADPENEQLVLDVTRVLILKREFDKANQLLERASRSTNLSSQILVRLGWVQTQLGKTNEAILNFKKSIEIEPFYIGGYQNLIYTLLNLKRTNEALNVIANALRIKTTNSVFRFELAGLISDSLKQTPELRNKLKQKLLNLLKEIRSSISEAPNNLIRLAEIYDNIGETQETINILKRLMELHPDNTELRMAIREKLMNIYLKGGERKNAIQQLKAIIAEQPTNPIAYYYLGSIYFEEKDYEKAAEFFNRTLILNPDFEPVYYDIAGALINANKPEDALRILNSARNRFQKQRFLLEFYSAMAYIKKKDYQNALKSMIEAEIIAKATETNRLTAAFYFQMGATLERNKDFKQAEKYFQKCLDLDPDFSEALNYLGYMWAEQNINLDKAKALIEKALRLEPHNAAYLDSMGWVYYRLKKYNRALYYLEKAAVLSKEPDPTIYDHLGDVYAALKRWDKAMEFWKKSLKLEYNEEIKKKLDSVQIKSK